MKKLIMMLSMLFTFTTISAKQFCVKIDCYYIDTTKSVCTVRLECVNVEDEINKYLNKGYKLISITPKINTRGHGAYTTCYYCIFDDCKD